MSSGISVVRDAATIIALLVGSVSAAVAVLTLRRNSRVQKAEFVASLAKDFYDDSDLRKFYYKIDYEEFKFDLDKLDSFKGSEDERRLDALLFRYNMVGRLVRLRTISISDIEFMIFELVQVFKNAEVAKYISWLSDEYEKHGTYGTNKRLRPLDDAKWLLEQLK
jgi:hypothetical protein